MEESPKFSLCCLDMASRWQLPNPLDIDQSVEEIQQLVALLLAQQPAGGLEGPQPRSGFAVEPGGQRLVCLLAVNCGNRNGKAVSNVFDKRYDGRFMSRRFPLLSDP